MSQINTLSPSRLPQFRIRSALLIFVVLNPQSLFHQSADPSVNGKEGRERSSVREIVFRPPAVLFANGAIRLRIVTSHPALAHFHPILSAESEWIAAAAAATTASIFLPRATMTAHMAAAEWNCCKRKEGLIRDTTRDMISWRRRRYARGLFFCSRHESPPSQPVTWHGMHAGHATPQRKRKRRNPNNAWAAVCAKSVQGKGTAALWRRGPMPWARGDLLRAKIFL